MITFYQTRRFFITMILAFMLMITIGFDFGTTSSWVTNLSAQLIRQPQPQLSPLNKVKGTTKNIDGKTHIAIDNMSRMDNTNLDKTKST